MKNTHPIPNQETIGNIPRALRQATKIHHKILSIFVDRSQWVRSGRSRPSKWSFRESTILSQWQHGQAFANTWGNFPRAWLPRSCGRSCGNRPGACLAKGMSLLAKDVNGVLNTSGTLSLSSQTNTSKVWPDIGPTHLHLFWGRFCMVPLVSNCAMSAMLLPNPHYQPLSYVP